MKRLNYTRRTATLSLAMLASLALGAGSAGAYDSYDTTGMNGGCAQMACHPDFKSVGSLHQQHVINLDISTGGPITGTKCNVCHTNGGGTTPVYTMGSNAGDGGGGLGCAGCHGQDYGETATTAPYVGEPKASAYGLRQVHQDAGVLNCQGCHGTNPFVPLDESVAPPYYGLGVSKLVDPCDSNNEDMSYDADTVGLDNDGNGFADYPADPNCPTTTTTTTTTSTTTTTLPLACPSSPFGSCTGAGKAKLQIIEKSAGKEKAKFILSKLVPAVAQADFGDPVGGTTSYALCVYDGSDTLVATYEPGRGMDFCDINFCWSAWKDFGYQYKDKTLSIGGFKKVQLKGGDAGKGKVKLIASNKEGTLTTGVAPILAGQSSATAQFINIDGDCFGMAMTEVKKADGLLFKAQTP
jgi:hypothetical protein